MQITPLRNRPQQETIPGPAATPTPEQRPLPAGRDDTSAAEACLLFSCPAHREVIPAVTQFLYGQGADITSLEEHWTDIDEGLLFMRIGFHTRRLRRTRVSLESAFARCIGAPFNMDWRIGYADRKKRVAILVSRYDHALMELLWQWSRGLLPCEMTMVISNHEDLRPAVENFGIPFHVVPMTAQTRADGERQMLKLLEGKTDLVVLARYMQILSQDFLGYYPNRVINIHHSFLPAFKGANPYRQAHERGVKLIGATAHYVTAELDNGPIIEQDVQRVSHRRGIEQLRELGEHIERGTLARAVRWHLEDRVIVHDNRTLVFYG